MVLSLCDGVVIFVAVVAANFVGALVRGFFVAVLSEVTELALKSKKKMED